MFFVYIYPMKNYVWHKQTISADLDIIDCPAYDPIKDFHRDPTGIYVLIRCDAKLALIEVAICDKNHTIINVFRGLKAQDLYYTIFQYEKKHQLKWFARKDHMAYLGKELKKAEIALSSAQPAENYVQE
jgi:hypothetical protein